MMMRMVTMDELYDGGDDDGCYDNDNCGHIKERSGWR